MSETTSGRTWAGRFLMLFGVPAILIAASGSTVLSPEPVVSETTVSPAPASLPSLLATPSPEPEPDLRALVDHVTDAEGNWVETRLPVPYLSQLPDMPTGCEVVSVTMLLQYAGADVTKDDIAEAIPYDEDPELGFQGDPYTWEGGIIYPPALLDLVDEYAGSAVDLTGASWEELTEYLEAGKPVVVWFAPEVMWSHTVVVTGYSATSVWINDPYDGLNDPWGAIPDSPGDGRDLEMSLEYFLIYWEGSGYRALSY
jgi:uncharacterized protein YvpB